MTPQQIDNGQKPLFLTDGSVQTPEFLEALEKEEEGFKLRYYMWLSRFFIATTVASMLFLISAALALFRLAPMVTVEPFLIINQDSSEEIVREEPITFDMSSKDKLMETFIRQYIIIRNTVINDPQEMRSRWMPGGMMHLLSAPDVFLSFYMTAESRWVDMFKQALVREVEIISIGRQGGPRSPVWKVDFRTYDLSDYQRDERTRGLSLRIRYWTASVTAFFIPERQFVGLRLINPLGFTVTRYSQDEVNM